MLSSISSTPTLVTSVDPSLIKLHTRRGRALLRLGHLTEAADSFTQACDVSPTLNVQESDLAAVRADGKNGLKSVVGVRSTLTRLGQLEISEDYTGVLGLVEDLNAQCPRSLLVLVSKCNALNKLTEWGETKECIEDFICSAHSSILRLAAHPSAQLPAPPAERLSWTEKQGKNIVIVDTEAVLQAVLAMGPALAELYLISLKNLDLNRNCSSDVMSRMLLIFEELTKFLKSSVKASIPCPDSPPPPLDLGRVPYILCFADYSSCLMCFVLCLILSTDIRIRLLNFSLLPYSTLSSITLTSHKHTHLYLLSPHSMNLTSLSLLSYYTYHFLRCMGLGDKGAEANPRHGEL